MTTTIIIVATEAITLYTLFLNIKDVCFVNIHPPSYKKNFASNFLAPSRPSPKEKATISQPSLFEISLLD
jgi:hypothetical protein